MAVFNIQRGFIYLAMPRTASRATVDALMELAGSVAVLPHHCCARIVFEKHPEARVCTTIFTTVRNPYDVLLSKYHAGGYSYGTWQAWLELRLSQEHRLFNRFLGEYTVVAKYETLQQDLHRIVGSDVVLKLNQDHISRGKDKDYMKKWKGDLRDRTRKHFAQDFEEFGY